MSFESASTSITGLVLDRVLRRKLRPLDPREFLGEVFALEYAARAHPAPGVADPQAIAGLILGFDPSDTFEPQSWAFCVKAIAELSGQLDRLVKRYRAARLELLPAAAGAPLGVVLVPVWEQSGKMLRLRHALVADELSAVFRYALALVLDEAYGKQLCRCGLPECRRFFLAVTIPGGGRPRRGYCTEEHMHIFHDRRAAKRVADYRKRHAGKRK